MSIHPGVYRARLGVVVAVVASFIALICWFPLGELLHQRGELSTLSAQVSSVATRNDTLSTDVRALHQNGTIETIAHEQFGLVRPGQISFVIEPAAGSTSGAPGLAPRPIALSDLVADQPAVAPRAASSATAGPNFWGRFVSRLAFWRHAR